MWNTRSGLYCLTLIDIWTTGPGLYCLTFIDVEHKVRIVLFDLNRYMDHRARIVLFDLYRCGTQGQDCTVWPLKMWNTGSGLYCLTFLDLDHRARIVLYDLYRWVDHGVRIVLFDLYSCGSRCYLDQHILEYPLQPPASWYIQHWKVLFYLKIRPLTEPVSQDLQRLEMFSCKLGTLQ